MVGEHVKHVLLLFGAFGDCSVGVGGATLGCFEGVVFFPVGLPLGLDCGKGVSCLLLWFGGCGSFCFSAHGSMGVCCPWSSIG